MTRTRRHHRWVVTGLALTLVSCGGPSAPTPAVVLALDPNPVTTIPSTAPCPPGRVCTTVLLHAPWTLFLASSVDAVVDAREVRVFRLDDGETLAAQSFTAADVARVAGTSHVSPQAPLTARLGSSFEEPIGPYRSRVIEVTAVVSPDGTPRVRETIRVPVH
jgi:hypothetical protein